jgi:hypothetical protein
MSGKKLALVDPDRVGLEASLEIVNQMVGTLSSE